MSIRVMSAVWDGPVEEPGDLLILLAIANHADDDGMAHPSMMRIARLARMTERGARKAIRRLEEAGYLTCHVAAGPNGRNRYDVHPSPEQRELFAAGDAPKKRQPGTQSSARNSVPPGTNEFRPDPEPMSSAPPGTQSSAKPSITSESKESLEQEFEIFYRAYPRRTGRGAAVKAFKTARKKTTLQGLLDGVDRYVANAERSRAAGAFVPAWKHPATWLNGECWLDEDEAPGQSSNDAPTTGSEFPGNGTESYAEWFKRQADGGGG